MDLLECGECNCSFCMQTIYSNSEVFEFLVLIPASVPRTCLLCQASPESSICGTKKSITSFLISVMVDNVHTGVFHNNWQYTERPIGGVDVSLSEKCKI